MPARSAPGLLTLVGLRTRSPVEADELAVRLGLDRLEVQEQLDEAERRGLARHRAGRLRGWTLTPEGQREGERQLAEELDELGLRSEIDRLYQRFRVLNLELLELCTAWQLREVGGDRVVNDHTDEDYDRAALLRLTEVDRRARPVLRELAGLLDRFSGYEGRLDRALSRIQEGAVDWFTSPSVDSYHAVWFELHEHLLATLGVARSEEGALA